MDIMCSPLVMSDGTLETHYIKQIGYHCFKVIWFFGLDFLIFDYILLKYIFFVGYVTKHIILESGWLLNFFFIYVNWR